MRRAAKRDDNEAAIIDALRAAGCSVQAISQPHAPDLLVGLRGVTYVLEVKRLKGKLRPGQKDWAMMWKGSPVHVVRTPEQALAAVGLIREHYESVAKKLGVAPTLLTDQLGKF